jgi:hypothetical protein
MEEGDRTMKTCDNLECRKKFKPKKPWGKYCCRRCGDLVRQRRFRAKE